jgi:hypothetical protein
MGRIHGARAALNPRTRVVEQSAAYVCYVVVLDVLPDFMLYRVPAGPETHSTRRAPTVDCRPARTRRHAAHADGVEKRRASDLLRNRAAPLRNGASSRVFTAESVCV